MSARARGLAFLASLVALAGGAATAEEISGPQLDYVLQCMGCHGEDGLGSPGRVPTLVGVGRFLHAPGGRAYLVRVPGVAHAPLDDARVAGLLEWMLRRYDPAGLGAAHVPYTADEVAALRAVPLVDPDATRRALLRDLESSERSPE
jgi:hypothetical protein